MNPPSRPSAVIARVQIYFASHWVSRPVRALVTPRARACHVPCVVSRHARGVTPVRARSMPPSNFKLFTQLENCLGNLFPPATRRHEVVGCHALACAPVVPVMHPVVQVQYTSWLAYTINPVTFDRGVCVMLARKRANMTHWCDVQCTSWPAHADNPVTFDRGVCVMLARLRANMTHWCDVQCTSWPAHAGNPVTFDRGDYGALAQPVVIMTRHGAPQRARHGWYALAS